MQAGRDATLDAGQDLAIEGGQVAAENNVSLIAGRDIAVESAKNNQQTSSSSSSASANAGFGATASAANGVAAGVQVSGAASGSLGNSRSDSNTNAEVYAGQTLTVESGRDTTVAGANLEGDKVDMDVGGDLTVASRQDTGTSGSSNWSVGGTATVGAGASVAATVGLDVDDGAETGNSANIGSGQSSASSAWVNEQTSIIGREEVDIHVAQNTHVEGAVIAAENGNLKLDTDTLTYKDIHDHDTSESYQASLSGSKSAENAKNNERQQGKAAKEGTGNPYDGTLDGSYDSHDRRQINRATIGEGEIIIRSDPAAGLEGLNRDLEKAQEITRDEKTSVTVYIDSSAIAEVASGGEGIVEGFENTGKKIQQLAKEIKAVTASLPPELKHLGDAGLVAMQDMIRGGVADDAISKVMKDERFQKILTKAADLTESLKTYDVNSEVVSRDVERTSDGTLVVNISLQTPLREQLLNLLSATKSYIASIPYKEEAQIVLLGLQTAIGGPIKTAVSIVGNAILEFAMGEKLEEIKTEAATEIAARLRYQCSSQEVLEHSPDGFDEDVDAAKFGLNLAIGSIGAVVAGKAILADMTKAVATFRKIGLEEVVEFDAKTIRFTQDSISNEFKKGQGSLKGLIDDLKSGKVSSDDIPPIRVFEKDGKIYTLDNRRLKVFQEAEVPIRIQKATAKEVADELPGKFSTVTDGLTIKVRGGGL